VVSRFRAVAVVVLQMPTSPIRILAVDDHPLILNGVRDLIANHEDLVLVGEASTAKDAIEKYRGLRPDVTLMDIQMPIMDGIEATIAIRREFPTAKLIMLTTYDGDVRVHRALKAGAQAYVLKTLIRTELLTIVRAVHQGLKHVQPDLAIELASHAGGDMLSQREVQVLELIAAGNSNKIIGARLFINEETVKGYIKRIFGKLQARDRTHAVMIGLRRGIIRM
jgi:DNA-binding NarL/FixJ family response regulator